MSAPSPAAHQRRILLYSDGNTNLIDGSTIWLISMAQVLARTGSHVTLLLKAKVVSGKMLGPLAALDNVTIVDPFEGKGHATHPPAPLTVDEVARYVVGLDREHRFDKVVARGFKVANELARTREFDGRLWPYVIDLPEPGVEASPELMSDLEEIALASERMLVQTEDSRSYMEHRVPASAGKCLVLYPVIPDDLAPLPNAVRSAPGHLKGVYSGKFAEGWHTLELCELPERMAARGVNLTLSLIGDKFMQSPTIRTWRAQMQRAVGSSPGVEWAGGLSREDALAYCRTADIGFSWRSQALDSTHELSTKVLEYCAMGVAPVLNRIAAHIELLGEDYPLFVDSSFESVEAAVQRVSNDPDLLEQARKTALDSIDQFRMAAAAERLRHALEATEVRPSAALAQRSALFVGEDLHASSALYGVLRDSVGTLQVAQWDRAVSGQEAARAAVIAEPAVTVLEDAEPYLPWVTGKKTATQRLVVHVRDLAADENALRAARLDAVDAFVFDDDVERARFGQLFDVPADHLHRTPIPVDTHYFDRPGIAGRQLRIGVLGLCPSATRPDLAVDLLHELLGHDDRFSLHFRDDLPWNRESVWSDVVERDYYQAMFARLAQEPDLRARVAFERPGADLPGWYRKIGWLVIPRHHSRLDHRVIEAQAAGVVVRTLAGDPGRDVVGADARYSSLGELVESIAAATAEPESYERASAASRDNAAVYDVAQARPVWEKLLTG